MTARTARAWLREAVERRASDLHFVVGLPPAFRIAGEIVMADAEALGPAEVSALVGELLADGQRERFDRTHRLGFSFLEPDLGHFRVSVYSSQGHVEAAIRIRTLEMRKLEELGLPPVVEDMTRRSSGLVLITGPTGSGKTTTLYAMVDLINRERRCKIITVEDPVEYQHTHHRSIVVQQELGRDFDSFHDALVHILRLDPEVICVGEMRDLETISTALTAAETGHLVIATLHTADASQTIDRIIDVFPTSQQQQVRAQLAGCLQGVVSQQLVPTVDKTGRVLACEVLVATDAVRQCIREGKIPQLASIIQTGRAQGMHSIDNSLKELYARGLITYDAAASRARNPKQILDA